MISMLGEVYRSHGPPGEVTLQATTAGELVVNGSVLNPQVSPGSLSTTSPHAAISGPWMGE